MRKTKTMFKIILLSSILFTCLFLLFCILNQEKKTFKLHSDASFYMIRYDGIDSYQVKGSYVEKLANQNKEIIKGQINQVIHRAELNRRYLVFSEEGPPLGKVGRIISIDFQKGTIGYLKTLDYAYTSSGSSASYYFTSEASPTSSFLAAFDTQLKQMAKIEFPEPIIAGDFLVDDEEIYLLGTDIEGEDFFPTNLYHLSLSNKTLTIVNAEAVDEDPQVNTLFTDSLVRKKQLYVLSPGYRVKSSNNQVALGRILHMNLESGQKEWLDLPQIAPINIYDLGKDLLAIEHEKNEAGTLGISLFNLDSKESKFIDLTQFGLSPDEDSLKDVKRLNDDTILILVGKKLLAYRLSDGQILFEESVKETAFHIWVP